MLEAIQPIHDYGLFFGQHVSRPMAELCALVKQSGGNIAEPTIWGDGHIDVTKGAADDGQAYCDGRVKVFTDAGLLPPRTLGTHLPGQNTGRTNAFSLQWGSPEACEAYAKWRAKNEPPKDDIYFVPAEIREMERKHCVQTLKDAGTTAGRMGIEVLTGFTGSSIWHEILYRFPPVAKDAAGVPLPEPCRASLEFLKETWWEILEHLKGIPVNGLFRKKSSAEDAEPEQVVGVKFGLEVHPTERAFGYYSTEATLDFVDHPMFGILVDPSHLEKYGVSAAAMVRRFSDKVFAIHLKDALRRLVDGLRSTLDDHLEFNDDRKGTDFRSMFRGTVNFEEFIRALIDCGLDMIAWIVEWEDDSCNLDVELPRVFFKLLMLDMCMPSGPGFQDGFKTAPATDAAADEEPAEPGPAAPPAPEEPTDEEGGPGEDDAVEEPEEPEAATPPSGEAGGPTTEPQTCEQTEPGDAANTDDADTQAVPPAAPPTGAPESDQGTGPGAGEETP